MTSELVAGPQSTGPATHAAIPVTPGDERLDELTIVEEQAREAVGHDELVAVAGADKVRHDEAGDREDENESLFGGHGVCWLLVEKLRSTAAATARRRAA